MIVMAELTSEDVAVLTQKLGIAEESVLKQHASYLGGLNKLLYLNKLSFLHLFKINTRLER